ncbi:hypothetical protein [Rossellomorea vietnamensis]|uniref:Uncharacterized protein n=1 Tax=Rossellomorea vietnamensis TaxID=218284 RepID=A0A0N8GGT9_9BACI|nr:hypothetical protein [Rossellomorea vietnamensis]KPL59426.1 hypothetical protein AM506_10725 [Rossellomorea vietnamensis]
MLNREDLLQNLINKLKTSDEYRVLSPHDQKRLQSALIEQFQALDLIQFLPSRTNPQIEREVT